MKRLLRAIWAWIAWMIDSGVEEQRPEGGGT